jgi:hypothetical protein
LVVFSVAAARQLEVALQAMIAPALLFALYRVNYSRFALPTLPRTASASETTQSEGHADAATALTATANTGKQQHALRPDRVAQKHVDRQRCHSVLPSMFKVQLAVIVVSVAGARQLQIPLQALVAPSFLFALYRANYSLFALPILPAASKSADAAPAKAATGNHCSQQVATTVRGSDSKGSKVTHSVMPSVQSVQLAALVAFAALGHHLGMPAEPMKPAFIMFAVHRGVLMCYRQLRSAAKKSS